MLTQSHQDLSKQDASIIGDETPDVQQITSLTAPRECTSAISAALVDGLRITNRKLNEACQRALVAICNHAVETDLPGYLECLSQDRNLKLQNRQRLADTMDQMAVPVPTSPAEAIQEALFAALRVSNDELNRLATDTLVRMGPIITSELICKAFAHKGNAKYCVRLLAVVEKIGQPLPPAAICDMTMLSMRCKNPDVVEAVVQVMSRCR